MIRIRCPTPPPRNPATSMASKIGGKQRMTSAERIVTASHAPEAYPPTTPSPVPTAPASATEPAATSSEGRAP